MHAEAIHRSHDRREGGLGSAIAFAIGLHIALALLFLLSSLFSWDHSTESAAGLPVMDASLDASAADMRVAKRALQQVPEPLPQPVEEQVVEEDTVPPPQPIAEPRPQDSPTPQQQVAQERIPVPDTQDQDEASRLAISREKALREQEAKRRQEQIDLTEQKRVEEAQKQQRLSRQQEEADKQARLAEIRRQRAQLDQQQKLAEQKLRQIADARSRATSAPAAQASTSQPAGTAGADANLNGEYAAAIQKAVLSQWIRPDSVPLGQRCTLSIRQLPGGEVVEARVAANCPYDEAGKRSIEAAVLRAQPLPYRGFESVFQRNLTFNFTAQDQ